MLKKLAAAAVLVTCQAAFAADSFVIVQGDAALKVAGLSRETYNEKNPAAAKRWREAWAANGTKADTREFADIRTRTSKPGDMPAPATGGASTPTKGN